MYITLCSVVPAILDKSKTFDVIDILLLSSFPSLATKSIVSDILFKTSLSLSKLLISYLMPFDSAMSFSDSVKIFVSVSDKFSKSSTSIP